MYGDDSEVPKIYLDKNGKPTGMLVEVLKFIESRSALSFQVELLPWSRSYKNAVSGKGGIIGLSRSAAREKVFYFSDPVYVGEVLLVGLKSKEANFKGLSSLDGATVGVTRGGIYGDKFQELVDKKKIKLIEVNNVSQRLGMLMKSRVDWVVVGSGMKGLINSLITVKGASLEDLYISPKTILSDYNYIGFKKNQANKKILDLINKVLRSPEGRAYTSSYILK